MVSAFPRIAVALVGCAAALLTAPALAEDAVGNWFGAMDGHKMTFVHIERGPNGLGGWIDTHEPLSEPDNQDHHAALEKLDATPDRLTFHFVHPKSNATFDGHWDAGKMGWTGKVAWSGGHQGNLTLWRTTAPALALATMPPPKEVDDPVALDKAVRAYVDNGSFMGAVLVARGDRILLDKAYGYADLAWMTPHTTSTRFNIASISKQFAAAAILMLEERGKLGTDDPIGKYIPGTPEAWKPITLHQLLTHTSGIPNFDTSEWARKSFRQSVTPDEIIADAEKRPVDFAAGSQYAYSNTNYTLLARIVELVSGDTYAGFLAQNIFGPLDMKETTLDNGTDIVPHRANGYDFGSGGLVNAAYEDASWVFGCGSIVSTTHDLLRWERGLMGGKVLRPDTVKRMTTPYRNRYGYGVGHGPFSGYSVIEHAGAFHGFTSDLAYFPDDKLTIIVLGNVWSDAPQKIWPKLAMVSHGDSVDLPPARSFAKVSPAVLKTYAGTYRLKGGKDVAIATQGDGLVFKVGDFEHILTAQSDTTFFLARPDVSVQFIKDGAGIRSVSIEQDGQKETAPRKE